MQRVHRVMPILSGHGVIPRGYSVRDAKRAQSDTKRARPGWYQGTYMVMQRGLRVMPSGHGVIPKGYRVRDAKMAQDDAKRVRGDAN